MSGLQPKLALCKLGLKERKKGASKERKQRTGKIVKQGQISRVLAILCEFACSECSIVFLKCLVSVRKGFESIKCELIILLQFGIF